MKPRHKVPSPKEAGFSTASFFKKLFSKSRSHEHPHNHNHGSNHNHSSNTEPADISINTIALIIDGQVYDVLRAQDMLADLLLAQPTFVLVTEETSVAKINYKYVDGKFIENEPTT